jgi:SNF2 family DNA or RNA helicase
MALTCLEELQARWERSGVRFLPYQIEAARRIVDDMDGQGILADEVGLGKTIEAGLVACELMKRGRVRDVLVLCPASLCYQWQRELGEKFGLRFAVNPPGGWGHLTHAIASLDMAKREPHRAGILARRWDLVVVDEAHKLKNRNTQNHQFVRALRRGHLLLLSATPLQNDLTELYSLVSLVRPGLFGSFHAFWRQFLQDRRTPKDPAALREVLGRVMVRHRRRELPMSFPSRQVALLPIKLCPQERALYDAVSRAVREEYWRRMAGEATILPLLTLQREVCSSVAAVRQTLWNVECSWLGDELQHLRDLAEQAQEQSKARTLEGLLRRIPDAVLVYTEFRATQDFLAGELRRMGRPVVIYNGELSAWDRDRACRRFAATPGAVMVSTESGGQGLNFQFCRHLVNYDLPWNPMRVEQRIGRVHRLGQAQDVFIYNLYAQGTVEEHILRLLDEKINLFRQVVGELDVILRRFEHRGRRSLESRILEILTRSRDERELAGQFDALGRQMAFAARRARLAEQLMKG